ncbi:MAG: beta-propeller domain-containing protein [Candidatus Accumulibacter sp.]|nr:beta-propeller domain-containing protein [Accumulibacter sp.]
MRPGLCTGHQQCRVGIDRWRRGPDVAAQGAQRFRQRRRTGECLQALGRRGQAAARRTACRPDRGIGVDQGGRPARWSSAAVAKEAGTASVESVTNVQHAGVDEGGIVKLHGEHLVILRRGRLFFIRIGDNELRPVSPINAWGKDIDLRGAWYDEMLISGSTIVVIGYSYARGGTEVGVFDISHSGQLAYPASCRLRSNDYHSSRNYASRLIGSKLMFYSSHALDPWGDPYAAFPVCAAGGQGRCRKTSGGSHRRRASIAATSCSTPSPVSHCTVSPSASWHSRRSTARAAPCSVRRGASFLSRRTRCSCGPPRRNAACRPLHRYPRSSAFRSTARHRVC